MGLFDRLLRTESKDSNNEIKPRSPAKAKAQEFFLDADDSQSLGNIDYMRESKTIRHTFPGTVDSPGTKERVMEVAAKQTSLSKKTEGLGGEIKQEESYAINAGVPKAVRKTFAEQVSSDEMKKRLQGTAASGAASSVNTTANAKATLLGRKAELKPKGKPEAVVGEAPTSNKPGSIDPFRAMVRDLNK